MNKAEMGWRCPRKGCRQEVALRSGTYFEGSFHMKMQFLYPGLLSIAGSKLGIEKIMRMVYLWSVKTPLGKMKEEMEVRL